MRAIIFDIDGTLIRKGYGQKQTVEPVKDLVKFSYSSDRLKSILLTSRSNNIREKTRDSLRSKNIPYDYLIMRSEGQMGEPGYRYKRKKVRIIRNQGYELELAVEDRDRIARMLREEGIKCLKLPENNRYKHRFFDYFRRIYPYAPKIVQNFYLKQYEEKFK